MRYADMFREITQLSWNLTFVRPNRNQTLAFSNLLAAALLNFSRVLFKVVIFRVISLRLENGPV